MTSSIYKNGVYQAAAMRPNTQGGAGMKMKRRSIGNQAESNGIIPPAGLGGKFSEKGSPKVNNLLNGS